MSGKGFGGASLTSDSGAEADVSVDASSFVGGAGLEEGFLFSLSVSIPVLVRTAIYFSLDTPLVFS